MDITQQTPEQNFLHTMSRYTLALAVAERAKMLHTGARPLIDMGPRATRPLEIALEEVRRGLIRIELTPNAPSDDQLSAAAEEIAAEAEDPVEEQE
jgi:DNA-directed RNA polymerase subunit K/omega